MVWIHYSKKPIEKLLNDSECNNQRPTPKPLGLWLSKDTEWLEWMKSEMPQWVKKVKYIYKISIKKNANILKISSFKDLVDLHNKYMNKYRFNSVFEDDDMFEPYTYEIDWKRVCSDYDGIIFTNYYKILEKVNKLSENSKYYRTVFEWYHTLDINSACIFRPSKTISKIELVEKF